MKRILAVLIAIALGVLPAQPIGKWSTSYQYLWGNYGTSTVATLAINAAFVYETSGTAFIIKFNAPASQTNASLTFYVYCTAVTGVPDLTAMDVFASAGAGEDPQRPDAGAAAIATSSTTDASGCGTAKWLTYTVASVSLTAGNYYFLAVKNTEADPVNNNFTVTTRGIGRAQNANGSGFLFLSGTTTNGITTDPTITGGGNALQPHGVIKLGGGAIIGYPFVASAASTSNTNYRGTRFNFDEDVVVSGVISDSSVTTTIATTVEVYNGVTQLATVTQDVAAKGVGLGAYFTTPITFPGGVDIDVVFKPATASTTGTYFTIGTSPPADVTTSAGTAASYVNGATPGSFTETDSQIIPITLIIDTNPAIAGGSGGYIITGKH